MSNIFNKDLDLRIASTSFKIKKNYLSFKDPIPDALKSLLIYNFKYAGCNSCYIDQRDNSPIFHKGEGTSIDRQKFVYAEALASLS